MRLESLHKNAMNLIAPTLKSLSLPPRRCIYGRQGTQRLDGSSSRTNWILSRRFLRHGVFEVPPALPENKRTSALSLQVRRWAPFAQTKFAAYWVGHRASVYAWDAASINAVIAENGELPARCGVWPETFFRPAWDEGVRLVTAIDGYEGQAWRNGLLVATRWWAELPSAGDWLLFKRSAGAPSDAGPTEVPAPIELPILDLPWTETPDPIANAWSMLQSPRIAAAVAVVVFAPLMFYLTQWVATGIAAASKAGAQAALTASSQAVRADRAAAMADRDVIEAYLGLEPYPPQFVVVTTAMKLIADKKVSLLEWTYDNGALDFILRGTEPLDASAFIELFERSGMFVEVSGTLTSQERELRMKTHVKRTAAQS